MPARFIIQPKDTYYGFLFEGDNSNIILFSRLFRSMPLCHLGIDELRQAATLNDRFEKIQDKYGQYSFILRNKKGIMLGHSATFFAASTRDYAMKQIMREATDAVVAETEKSKPLAAPQ